MPLFSSASPALSIARRQGISRSRCGIKAQESRRPAAVLLPCTMTSPESGSSSPQISDSSVDLPPPLAPTIPSRPCSSTSTSSSSSTWLSPNQRLTLRTAIHVPPAVLPFAAEGISYFIYEAYCLAEGRGKSLATWISGSWPRSAGWAKVGELGHGGRAWERGGLRRRGRLRPRWERAHVVGAPPVGNKRRRPPALLHHVHERLPRHR